MRLRKGRLSMTCWKAGDRCTFPWLLTIHMLNSKYQTTVSLLKVHLCYQALNMHQLARTKAEEEERIAAVLQQRMLSSERSAKELQQLRNESAELRDLQVNTYDHLKAVVQ